jgi:rhodanese-related sulfurtransferase
LAARWISVLFAVTLACSSRAEPGTTAAGGHRSDVDIEAFASKVGAGAVVVDVRTPEEYAGGHVPGAVLVPLSTLDPAKPPFDGYAKDAPIYLVCATGRRSATAADRLAAAGFTAVNVTGGTSAWVAAGHPVE